MLITDPIAEVLGPWSSGLGAGALLLRILLSVLLAGVVGCERLSKRHSAGLRTFILIALSSAAAMELDLCLNYGREAPVYTLPAAVVVGLAIVSVHSLLYNSKNKILGLTTAVSMWACGIGSLCIGAGLYTVGLGTFLLLLPSLAFLARIEFYFRDRSNYFEMQLELKNSSYLQDFVAVLRQLGLTIDDIEANPAYLGSGLSVYSIAVSIHSEELRKYKTHREIIEALQSLPYVSYLEEM